MGMLNRIYSDPEDFANKSVANPYYNPNSEYYTPKLDKRNQQFDKSEYDRIRALTDAYAKIQAAKPKEQKYTPPPEPTVTDILGINLGFPLPWQTNFRKPAKGNRKGVSGRRLLES